MHTCEMRASLIRGEVSTRSAERERWVHRTRTYWGLWLPEAPPSLDDLRVLDFAQNEHGLIVVGSLIRFSLAADENDATEMSKIMTALRGLQRLGATVLVLHHASEKSVFTYRGSS
jgi:hypothetical protein